MLFTSPDASVLTSPRRTIFRRAGGLCLCLALLCLLAPACSKNVPPSGGGVETSAPTAFSPRPADFILCVDNSASIQGEEQVIIREATMLIADLADPGDQVCLVTFGKGARVATRRVIRSDADRVAFRKEVRESLDFKEQFSDIRACLRLLAKGADSPLRQQGFDHRVVLLSDGLLEPADKDAAGAYQEMKGIMAGELSSVPVHALVLGDTSTNRPVPGMGGATGRNLMEKDIASSAGNFFHARSLDQLFRAVVDIFNIAKGVSSFGEEKHADRFRIDDTVETMLLVIRKRQADGSELCRSQDIQINPPAGQPVRKGESVYKSREYRYFDLAVIKNPRPGVWSVTLANGQAPQVMAKIDSPLTLRYDVRPLYYENETVWLNAWIYDTRARAVVTGGNYRIRAHLMKDCNNESSTAWADLVTNPRTGVCSLAAPSDLLKALGQARPPCTMALELVAQRMVAGGRDADPWFTRRSGCLRTEIAAPFVSWRAVAPVNRRYPFLGLTIRLGAVLTPNAKSAPDFDTPPRVQVLVDRLDDETGKWKRVVDTVLDGAPGPEVISYQTEVDTAGGCCGAALASGSYRYSYCMTGVRKNGGAFLMASPWEEFSIRSYACESVKCCILAGLCVLILLLALIAWSTATLKGNYSKTPPQGQRENGRISGRQKDMGDFVLRASRVFFGISWVQLRARKRLKVNGEQLSPGKIKRISGRRPINILLAEAGQQTRWELRVRV